MADRWDIRCAIWRLDRDRFINRIVPSITARNDMTAERVVEACDVNGIENRFFRLDPEVARWIDETEPAGKVDFLLL